MKAWISEQLTERASTRGLAVARLMLMGVLFFRTMEPLYMGNLGDPWARLATLLLVLSACSAFVGYRTRISLVVVLLSFYYLHVYHGMFLGEARLKRGIQLGQVLFGLALSPCGRSLSVDRWLAVRSARAEGREPPPEEGPRWTVWIFAISLSAMYFWAGVDKVDPGWLTGQRVDRLFLLAVGSSDTEALYPGLVKALAVSSAWFVVLAEFVLALGLLVPRWRPYMVIPGLALHLGIWMLIGVWPFTISCISNYAVIASPALIHRFFDLVSVRSSERPTDASPRTPLRHLRVLVAIAFVGLCIQGPLRARAPQVQGDATAPRAASWRWALWNVEPRSTCDLRYELGTGGSAKVLERWVVLGEARSVSLPDRARFVRPQGLEKSHRELCAALRKSTGSRKVDLRAFVRCPGEGAWETKADGERNVCARSDSTRGRKKP
jgi:hypothetical protein